MINNLGLFVTHHVFLTDEQIASVASGETISCVGHSVPVWIDAKTGRTTEPAKEVFCLYEVHNSTEKTNDVEVVGEKGYSLWLPKASMWSPPAEIDFDSMADWTEERRSEFLKERESWWFNNPRPPDADNLSRGYLRFEVKKKDLKMGRRKYSAQHIVEISKIGSLLDSLTS